MTMNRLLLAGIDYSLVSPAVCLYCGEIGEWDIRVVGHEYPTEYIGGNENDCGRYDALTRWTMDLVQECSGVALENYAFAAKGKVFHIAENTGILKHRLWEWSIPCVLVEPTVVKKFGAGKGNATKPDMHEAFKKEIKSNLPELYKVDVLEFTDDLQEYFGSSYCQYILADEESLDIPNAGKLSSTILSIDRDSPIKPYLYYWSDFEQGDIDKYLMQGIEKCIKRPEKPEKLYDLLNETFEVNLVEVIRKSDELILLRRRKIETAAAAPAGRSRRRRRHCRGC